MIIGGGITGDIQINDTHYHSRLKKEYRAREMNLMLKQLQQNPQKIPSPSRDEIMSMLKSSIDAVNVSIDATKGFNELFVTNALDGSEDYLVSDRLFSLVGRDIQKFRETLKSEQPPGNIKQLVAKLIPPKGVKRKNIEGTELMDCEGDEMRDFTVGDENLDEENEEGPVLQTPAPIGNDIDIATSAADTIRPPEVSALASLNVVADPDIQRDSIFLDELTAVLERNKTLHPVCFSASHNRAKGEEKRKKASAKCY